LLGACVPEPPSGDLSDTIYRGGDIVTVDEDRPTAEAVAVRDGTILAVGDEAEVLAHKGPGTEIVDLEGKTLAPGLIDGHAHFFGFGVQAVAANLLAPPDGEVRNIEDLVATLREWAKGDDVKRTGWIFGMGYDDAMLAEHRHPTRDDLDRVSTDIPVIAIHISGHLSAVNSKALRLVGYGMPTPDPEGGVIRRRPGTREPNGVLEELAHLSVLARVFGSLSEDDQMYFLEKAQEMATRFGYTTAQEGRATAAAHTVLARAAEQGRLAIDVVSYLDYANQEPLHSGWNRHEYENHYRVGGMKITLDGSPQGRTAWRTEPYLIPPEGQEKGYAGYPAIPDDDVVVGLYETAYQNHWQVLTHANGDAAIDQMIRGLRAAEEKYGREDRRPVLVHGQFVRQDQLDALKELGVIPSLFPMHTFYWGDWYRRVIGPERAAEISPTRSVLDRGMIFTSHTDAPVTLPNLMRVLWATVNRVSRSGEVIGPGERVTPLEALESMTIWSAYQHFEEDTKGSIEPGKLADFVILSGNPLEIDPMNIADIEVLATIKEGQTVYERKR